MNKISIMKDFLSVTKLIRKLNNILNIEYYGKKLPCMCMFRLYNQFRINSNSNNETCYCIHSNRKTNKLVDVLLKSFLKKNILYINLIYYEKIIHDHKIYMMLPLIIHLHIDNNNNCHFHIKSIPLKLNNNLIKYTNLLILNFIPCDSKQCKNYNNLLEKTKIIQFEYAIFINYKTKKIQQFLQFDNVFSLQLGKFLNNN